MLFRSLPVVTDPEKAALALRWAVQEMERRYTLLSEAQVRDIAGYNRKLPELDQGMAALLTDLYDKGLLESTIVFCTGEFGRTPKVASESPWNGGRHHFGACFSSLLAGGGFRHGQHHAFSTTSNYPLPNLYVSMLQRLGIESDTFASSTGTMRGLELA